MTDEKETTGWDAFLEDKAEDGASYIVPNIETKLSKEKRQECREIVQEIKEYGVSQRQLLYLVGLLALELEDQVTMKAITKAIGENRERVAVDVIEKSNKSGLILPGDD